MGQIAFSLPSVGLPNSTEQPKVATALSTIQTVINGNLDATNVSATLAQSAGVNQSGQTVKGSSIIATSETRTNVAYGTMPTPDQVTGLVLPANGLIEVLYQATWQESVSGAASVAFFVGANQLRIAQAAGAAAALSSPIGTSTPVNTNTPLASFGAGLISTPALTANSSDVTTGQVVGVVASGTGLVGGPCYIFAAAGTYTVSVQYKASSGSVTASNRRLYVRVFTF